MAGWSMTHIISEPCKCESQGIKLFVQSKYIFKYNLSAHDFFHLQAPSNLSLSPQTLSKNPFPCNAEWAKKCTSERERRKKNDWKKLPLAFRVTAPTATTYIFFPPSFPPFLSSAFLSRHASVPANQHHSGQRGWGGKKRREGREDKTKEHCCCLAGGSTPDWRGAVVGERVWLRGFIIKKRD